jgi:LPXTG-motif cell wall-anchored protein
MKSMKKCISLFMVMAMALAFCTTAFAVQTVPVGTGTGSITITNATKENEYKLYKLFDATYQEDAVAYSYTKGDGTDAIYNLLTGANSPFALEQVRDTSVYNVTLKSGKDAAAVSTWITNNLNSFTALETVTAEDYVVKFTTLSFGYYFITSGLGATITVDSNTPDVSLIDKNQGPTWDIDENGSGKVITADSNKTYTSPVKENSVNVGDTVTFKIGVNTTNYNEDDPIIEYFINDELGKGFSYNKNSVKVFIGATELNKVNSNPVVGQSYVIAWDDASNSFKITIPWYNATTKVFASADANNTLTVTYTATLNDNTDTVYAGAGNKNTATYDFRDADDPTTPPTPGTPYHTVEEKETTTYTFALGFQKIDGKTKEPLPGAEFQVKNAAGAYLVAAEESPAGSGVYLYTGTAASEGGATTFKTDSTGKLLIKGIAEGSYTVVETKAPNGYNNLASAMTISASKTGASTYKKTYTTYYDENGNVVNTASSTGATLVRIYDVNAVDLVVENNKGVELPETGGIGTTIFYALGGLMVAGSAILLITRKRMKYENH